MLEETRLADMAAKTAAGYQQGDRMMTVLSDEEAQFEEEVKVAQ